MTPASPALSSLCSTYLHSAVPSHRGVTQPRDCSASSYTVPGDASTRSKVTFWERCHFFFNTAKHPPICHKRVCLPGTLASLHQSHTEHSSAHRNLSSQFYCSYASLHYLGAPESPSFRPSRLGLLFKLIPEKRAGEIVLKYLWKIKLACRRSECPRPEGNLLSDHRVGGRTLKATCSWLLSTSSHSCFVFQNSAWCVWSVLGDLDPSQEKSDLPGELSHQ